VAGDPETTQFSSGATWETVIWPRWLPIPARLPLIAQITAAIALMAAVTMPRWADVRPVPDPASLALPSQPAAASPAPLPRGVAPVPAVVPRPAHLNLDVRHNFRSVDLSVTVDGKPALETKLAGSAKRFGVIGKRAERGFTRTFDVAPGVHLVRVRVRSAADKFDQTRVERFELDSAAVASMRIAADKSGLSVAADRPPVAGAPPAAQPAPAAALATAVPVPQPQQPQVPTQAAQMAQAAQAAQEASALAELYQSLRSILIAIAGFIASAATGFVVQEFMRSRRELIFATENAGASPADRRRRTHSTVTSE
jgi:hypothetical protein